MIREASTFQMLPESMLGDRAALWELAVHLAETAASDLTDGSGSVVEGSVEFNIPAVVVGPDGEPLTFKAPDGTEVENPPIIRVRFDVETERDSPESG